MKKRISIRKSGEDEWVVKNKKGDKLGHIEWYPKWKGFIWEQEFCMIMSSDCLQEIVDFMKKKEKS